LSLPGRSRRPMWTTVALTSEGDGARGETPTTKAVRGSSPVGANRSQRGLRAGLDRRLTRQRSAAAEIRQRRCPVGRRLAAGGCAVPDHDRGRGRAM